MKDVNHLQPAREFIVALIMLAAFIGQAAASGTTYRIYEGLTCYVHNPEGRAFTVRLEVRDLNVFSHGPRELLFKVYDPEGQPVVREFIPDDGITNALFADRIAGWDHELQYYANLYAKGTKPSFRWSEWSEQKRIQAITGRTFERAIPGGKRGVYRIVLAGTRDHVVTLTLTPELQYGIVGHPTWLAGSGDLLRKSHIYVPAGSTGIFFAVAEPDQPPTRHFRLTAPDGKVLFDGQARGGYQTPGGLPAAAGKPSWQDSSIPFPKPGAYDGQLLTLEVSDGAGAYLINITIQQPQEGAFADYTGMGSLAIYCADPKLAQALQGGTFVEDGLVFWHPFQARFHRWLKANPLDGSAEQKALRAELLSLFNGFRLLQTSDSRGSATWENMAYGMGYYGCKIFRPAWLLLKRTDVPQDIKDIIREGLIMGGDRLSVATGIECCNGNAFSQINVALWYCHRATGDPIQKERFEIFWNRWKTEGWGPGIGLSRSGDSQEFFAHDAHYGSYIMDNWKATGNTWVREGGILGDATDDPRFAEVIERYRELYTYLYCRETDGRAIAANPWSARTHMHPHNGAQNWEIGSHTWKGEPGPDFTVSVNGGDEWFAARRKGYYALTFHSRLTPEWECRTFPGQLGFGGGILCQLTVPGKGPVLASTLSGSYGTGMHPSNWRNFSIHSIVGLTWDGRPLISGISEHQNARLEGNRVTSSGEVRDAHVRVSRSYTFVPDAIECEAQLAESDFANVLSIWGWVKLWSEVNEAYEMIPFLPKTPQGQPTTVTLLDVSGKAIGPIAPQGVEAAAVRVDRGGFGVEVRLDRPRPVLRGAGNTVLIELVAPGTNAVAPEKVNLKYRLVPFGG